MYCQTEIKFSCRTGFIYTCTHTVHIYMHIHMHIHICTHTHILCIYTYTQNTHTLKDLKRTWKYTQTNTVIKKIKSTERILKKQKKLPIFFIANITMTAKLSLPLCLEKSSLFSSYPSPPPSSKSEIMCTFFFPVSYKKSVRGFSSLTKPAVQLG